MIDEITIVYFGIHLWYLGVTIDKDMATTLFDPTCCGCISTSLSHGCEV